MKFSLQAEKNLEDLENLRDAACKAHDKAVILEARMLNGADRFLQATDTYISQPTNPQDSYPKKEGK